MLLKQRQQIWSPMDYNLIIIYNLYIIMKMQRILEYVAIALMVLNIVGYALHKSISCIALFGVGAYIARCFSKNLTINIFAGLLVSNVFFGCSSLREGLDKHDLENLKEKIIHLIDGAEAKEDTDAASEDKVTGDTGCVVNAYGNKWIGDMTDEEKIYFQELIFI